MANDIRFFIAGQEVSAWVGWHAAELVVQRDTEQLTLAIELQRVKLIADAAQAVRTAFPSLRPIPARVQWAGLDLQGRIDPAQVFFADDYVLISVRLDELDDFARSVEGRLLDDAWRRDVRIVVAPRVEKATILMLLVSSFVIIYIVIKETFELGRDIAVLLGIAGAGIGGPVSSSIAAAALAVLRAAYIAALVIALVQLVREMLQLIERIETTRAISLYDALERFTSAAGFNIQTPDWLRQVWLLGGGVEEYEASEVFRLAKQLTRSILYSKNRVIRFIPLAASSFPAALRRAHEEKYRYNLDEVKRREIISLTRDASDEYTVSAFAAVEIDRPPLRGYERVDIPYAPARAAGDRAVFRFVQRFLQVLALFSARIRNIQAVFQAARDFVIVERSAFLRKLYYADDPERLTDEQALLQRVANVYATSRTARIYEARIPFSAADFAALEAAGFAGVRSLRWRVLDEYAEVEYEVLDTLNINQTIRIL